MFAKPAMHTPLPFDAFDVDARSDVELDTLPFGVIALDPSGIILRYNLYESRLARLDRNQVLGRRFFDDVAPCTRGEAFAGRVQRFMARRAEREIERFDFVFDFRFGAQHVVVEVVKVPGADRWYLFINRARIDAPRPNAEIVAPTQGELAPNEPEHGVLRDEQARRYVEVPDAFFASLRTTLEALAPESWPLFAGEWGVQLGRRLAIDLEGQLADTNAPRLAALPIGRLTDEVGRFFAERGFGALRFDYARAKEGVIVVTIERSALAESAPHTTPTTPEGASDLACHLLAGAIGGFFSDVAGKPLAAREVACRAAGHARCAVLLVGEARVARVDQALAEGVRGTSEVLARMATP
jgi:photoactive yellow protein